MAKPKVKFKGENGNVFNLLAICVKAMKAEGIDAGEITAMYEKVFSCGSYNEALQIMMEYWDIS